MAEKLTQGTQIVYVPKHMKFEDGVFDYPFGMEAGFVSSGPTGDGSYFCRYWRIVHGKITYELRTKSCSELTPRRLIRVMNTVPQEMVTKAIQEWLSPNEEK